MGLPMKGKGSRRSRQEWRSLLAKSDGSGLGVEAFCRHEAISAAGLYRWRGLVGTIRSVAVSAPRIDLRLEFGDGVTLRLVRG